MDDDDDDGVRDDEDNCPLSVNPDQSDADGNGAGKACDPGGYEDSDGDGVVVVDNVDNCPLDSNTDQANIDGDWLGDACDFGDFDSDLLSDQAEYLCGSDPGDAGPIPERLDGAFGGADDDGDTLTDEALRPGSETFDCDGDGARLDSTPGV